MKAPRDWRWCVLIGSLAVVVGATGCGRTEFDTGSEAAAATDAGTSTGLPTLPATPGLFVCGSAVCLTSSQQCCLGVSTSGAVSGTCLALSASCPGASLQCDEPADCASSVQGQGNVCCAGLAVGATSGGVGGISIGTQCVAASRCTGTTHLIVCRQDSDCHGAGVCCAGDGLPTCLPSCPKL